MMQRLRKKGFLDATNVPLRENVPGCLDTVPAKTFPGVWNVRLHAVMISMRWVSGANAWKLKAREVVAGKARYWLGEFKGATVQLFQNGRLVVYFPEVYGTSAEDCDAQMMKWLFDWRTIFEQVFQMRLEMDADRRLVWKVSRKHYAYEGHPFASAVKAVAGGHVKVFDRQGALRLETDESKGAPEVEVFRPSDARSIIQRDLQEYFVDGKLRNLNKDFELLVQLVHVHDGMLKKGGV